MSDLYDDDVVLWAERQADALRRRASNEVDWYNVADEIEGVARNEVSTAFSSIENILQHRFCIEGWPNELAVGKWRAELRTFNRKLRNSYTKSMTLGGTDPVTDKAVREIYTDAVEYCLSHMDTEPTRPVPPSVPGRSLNCWLRRQPCRPSDRPGRRARKELIISRG